jgi:ankyrin repeat protein
MAVLSDLPPELVHRIISLLTRVIRLDPEHHLGFMRQRRKLVPDLPSINALSQINTVFHHTLNQALYNLCASVDVLGKHALLFAVQHELESTLDKLVLAGISLDTEFDFDYMMLPLHIAAHMGLRTMVIKLLRIGLPVRVHTHSVNRRNLLAKTALDFAVRQGHLEIVRILAPIHNDVPLVLSEPHGQYLGRALHKSVMIGNLEISQYLVSEGADVNFLDGPRQSAVTPLVFAARIDNVQFVQLLLASGADPNLHIAYGLIPLFVAANIDIVRALVAGGADVCGTISTKESRNLAFIDNTEILRFFLERGVDPDHADNFGWTPLHSACLSEKGADDAKARVELLLQFGAKTVEKAERNGNTPVDYAMEKNYWEVVKTLEPLVQDPELKLRIARWWEGREGEYVNG